MRCFNQAGGLVNPHTEGEPYQDRFAPGYRWVRHRPVAVIHIDLEQDDCKGIAQQLDQWERIEVHRNPSGAG